MIDPDERAALHARLDASRAALLAALEGVTERDFASTLPDGSGEGPETVVQALARVAAEERGAVAAAEGVRVEERTVERPLPPQAIHGLAGARYRTSRYLDGPEASAEVARGLVAAAEARELEAARRVRGRPVLGPPPVAPEIPVIAPPNA
ncbi:MAG: hypothetical protein WD058_07685 [Dehalococcoidia bacterium]